MECDFFEKPPKAFQSECPICLLVLREPYQATCCGKSFCKECIEKAKVGSKRCPTCKTDNFFSYPNKGLQQSLNDFEVYCSHKSKCCEWRGELRELDKHLNSDPPVDKSLEGCPFTVISCPLSHTGCEVKLPRRDVKVHINDDLFGHLLKQTAFVHTLIQEGKSLNAQLQSVTTHLQNINAELDVVKREKHQLEQEVAKLKQNMEKLENSKLVASNARYAIVPVEIIMTNFSQQQDKEIWLSTPFDSHYNGYKMCLGVCPSGYGSGKGTHLGVTVHLMRGEFDDQLKWPFRGDVTVQLLNQEEDENHIEILVPFSDRSPNEFGDRVRNN